MADTATKPKQTRKRQPTVRLSNESVAALNALGQRQADAMREAGVIPIVPSHEVIVHALIAEAARNANGSAA